MAHRARANYLAAGRRKKRKGSSKAKPKGISVQLLACLLHKVQAGRILFLYSYLSLLGVCVSAILLGSLKMPYEEIRRRILSLEFATPQTEGAPSGPILALSTLEQILANYNEILTGSPEAFKQLEALRASYDELAEPDQFILTVRLITPFLPETIEYF